MPLTLVHNLTHFAGLHLQFDFYELPDFPIINQSITTEATSHLLPAVKSKRYSFMHLLRSSKQINTSRGIRSIASAVLPCTKIAKGGSSFQDKGETLIHRYLGKNRRSVQTDVQTISLGIRNRAVMHSLVFGGLPQKRSHR